MLREMVEGRHSKYLQAPWRIPSCLECPAIVPLKGAPGALMVNAAASTNSSPQAAPGTGANAITSLSVIPGYTPEMVVGFSAIPGEGSAAVNAAPSAGTGFTAVSPGVWSTWGGGSGDYLGTFETEQVSSTTSAVAATFTAQSSLGSGAYGSFAWVIPELGAVP